MSKIYKRIGLNKDLSNIVTLMAEDLNKSESTLKFSDSQLVSKILSIFYQKYFQKEKGELERSFFDRKKAIMSIMRSSDSPEELEKSLLSLLKGAPKKGKV